MGFGACGVGLSWFLGWISLYKHKIITLGKNGASFSGSDSRAGRYVGIYHNGAISLKY